MCRKPCPVLLKKRGLPLETGAYAAGTPERTAPAAEGSGTEEEEKP